TAKSFSSAEGGASETMQPARPTPRSVRNRAGTRVSENGGAKAKTGATLRLSTTLEMTKLRNPSAAMESAEGGDELQHITRKPRDLVHHPWAERDEGQGGDEHLGDIAQ